MKVLKMPDGTDIPYSFDNEQDAKDGLDEATAQCLTLFCPLTGSTCRDDCMFFNDGGVYKTEMEFLKPSELWQITLPGCTYGQR